MLFYNNNLLKYSCFKKHEYELEHEHKYFK